MSVKRASDDMLLWRGLALILAVSVLLLSFSGMARAATSALDNATSQVQALKDLLAQLDDQMGAATENYDYANQQLADTQAAIAETSKELTQGESDLAAAQVRFNQRVVEIYKNGDVTVLAVLMDANSFSDFVTRFEQFSRIGQQDMQLVKQVQAYTTQVATHQASLNAELKQETAFAAQTAAAKQKVLDQIARQNQALKGKEAQVAQIRKEQAAQQAALAAAAKKAAAAAAAQAAAAAAKTKTTTTTAMARTTPTSGARTTTTIRAGKTTTTLRGPATTTTSGGHATTTTSAPRTTTTTTGGGTPSNSNGVTGAAVVNYAMKFIGVPYLWAGSSPSGFDCSGFVEYVYAHFGIYLPHSSAMQYGYGTPVAQSQLKPGDLVFFYSPIHHVGLCHRQRADDQLAHRRGAGGKPLLEQLHRSPSHPSLAPSALRRGAIIHGRGRWGITSPPAVLPELTRSEADCQGEGS